ncbi:MAG: hypothetical protein M3271_12520, partial [Actinomycetota bacterium]|nr:hypothetical protein [Actinomycetota bacterium]
AAYWVDIRREWAKRVLEQREKEGAEKPAGAEDQDDLPGAGVPGANNWVTIGPSVARNGQASGNPPISGRISGIAVAPGGMRVYAASADGGVWRSDNGGAVWRPTMDSFDVDPAGALATSNTCGAIAIDPADPERVYVGTGEGAVDELFASRLLSSLPAYRGVGPVVSSDGGGSWTSEPTDSAATSLAGGAFFALALDPADRERVVAATTFGLYRREPSGTGFQWTRKRTNKHTSVVACRTGTTTTFYAAEWGVGVFSSNDGDTWTAAGTGLPTTGRITLAVRPTDPSVLYAIVANGSAFNGLYRLDGATGSWRVVSGLPALGGQANYNIPLAVDPNNANIVYVAGSAASSGDGSINRCVVTSSGSGSSLTYSMAPTFIGTGVHADVHVLVHTPTDSSTLWTGCDGGVWRTTTATGAGTFVHRNTGLSTFCCNHFSHDPAQPAIGLVGLQDNGTARYSGEEAWIHIAGGDGGTPVVNWADPRRMIAKINRWTYLATDGGQTDGSFTIISGAEAPIFGTAIVTTPYNPGTPADAGYVAYGSGRTPSFGLDLYISSTFGAAWGTPVATLAQRIFALDFASSSRLYVGTTGGQVYRLDRTGTTWGTPVRLDNAAGGALPLAGVITDIETDPFDTTGSSIYITFGGIGDARHVWHFDGTQWTNRSGSGSTALLNSSHNSVVVDPNNTSHVYVGADVGVWRSTDRGMSWNPMQNGLPDAPVFDLQVHPTARLLRASTHGRGMFEWRLDAPGQPDVELYVRDTSLDVGRMPTVDGLPDPETWPSTPVVHYLSRNIKVDVPTTSGYQTPTNAIDFLQFNDVIVDGSQSVGTLNPADGVVHNRVYVEVHNRGVVKANTVRVTLIVTKPSVAIAALPAGYEANIAAGTAITDSNWQTVGITTLTDLRGGFPLVAAFDLDSTMLPPPADLPAYQHHCSVAFLHSAQDPYTSTSTNVNALAVADRKVAQRNLNVVPFMGTPPPPGASDMWVAVDAFGVDEKERPNELLLDLRAYAGRVDVLLPEAWMKNLQGFRKGEHGVADKWANEHRERLHEFLEKRLFDPAACKQMIEDLGDAVQRPLVSATGGRKSLCRIRDVQLAYGERVPLFLRFEPKLKSETFQNVDILQADAESRTILGGNRWRLDARSKPRQREVSRLER